MYAKGKRERARPPAVCTPLQLAGLPQQTSARSAAIFNPPPAQSSPPLLRPLRHSPKVRIRQLLRVCNTWRTDERQNTAADTTSTICRRTTASEPLPLGHTTASHAGPRTCLGMGGPPSYSPPRSVTALYSRRLPVGTMSVGK